MKRTELYNLVWERPVTHVAKEFGLSDVAVRKICLKHGIPTPPLGYWAKLRHGKKVHRLPLPAVKEGRQDDVDLAVRVKEQMPDVVGETHRIAIEQERSEKSPTVPTERPAKLHPAVAASEKALRKAKPDEEGFVTSQGSVGFDLYIGPESIERVVLLIQAFIDTALDRGHQLSAQPPFRIVVDEQPLALRIYETKEKAAHMPTVAELKQQAQEDEWRAKYSSSSISNRKVYRTWDHFPSGRLALEISDPLQARWQSDPIIGRWRDRKATRLEEYLGEMMVALKTGGAMARHQRAKEAEEARLAKEAEERRRELELQRRLLEKVTAFLMEKADRFAQLVKLENFAAHLGFNRNQSGDGRHSELQRALEFALVNMRRQTSADSINQEIIRSRLLEPGYWY